MLEDSEAGGNAANALDDISTVVRYGDADDAIMRVVDTSDVGDEYPDLGLKLPSSVDFQGRDRCT